MESFCMGCKKFVLKESNEEQIAAKKKLER